MTAYLYPAPQPRGAPFQIPGADGWWQQLNVHYDYARDPLHCPNCGSVGIPWRGWYHCDGPCQGKGLVADGRFFVPCAAPCEDVEPHTYSWEP